MKYPKEYYVPVVVKNRDYLIGFLDAMAAISPIVDVDYTALDSMRFTDVLPDGQRRRNLTPQEIIDSLDVSDSKNHITEPNQTKELEVDNIPFLEVNCSCGNYIKFEHPSELPKTTRKCELCGNVLIDYTGHDQDDYEYDGDQMKMMIGFEIDEEYVDEDEDDDDYDEDDEE
jgi:ribosomal protein S27E